MPTCRRCSATTSPARRAPAATESPSTVMPPERSLEQLPADQQAVISLLVRQGRTYEQVAAVLRIDPDALRTRAHQALLGLAGAPSPELSDGEVGEVGDYVLGQQ